MSKYIVFLMLFVLAFVVAIVFGAGFVYQTAVQGVAYAVKTFKEWD